MSDGLLSQEEIDALLKGGPSPSSSSGGGGSGLSSEKEEILRELLGVLSNSMSNVLSMLTNKDVGGEVSILEATALQSVADKVGGGDLIYSFGWGGVVSGASKLVMSERDALAISDLMMGGNGLELPDNLNELYQSAVNEALSQMLGSVATSLGGVLGGSILIKDSNGELREVNMGSDIFPSGLSEDVLHADSVIRIADVGELHVHTIMPISVADAFADAVMKTLGGEKEVAPAPKSAPAPSKSSQPASKQQAPRASSVPSPSPSYAAPSAPSRSTRVVEEAEVRPVEFAPLGGPRSAEVPQNIDLVMDIPVRVTVELGRTRRTVKEILALGPGAVIQLEKLAGEPADVLVNGKLVARGEVVVVDENFGVRVTEIVSQTERIKSMGSA